MHTSFSPGASLSPKRSRQDRRDSGVSAAVWEWLRPVDTSFTHEVSLFPKRPRHDLGDSGVSADVWEWRSHAYLVLRRGVPIPKRSKQDQRASDVFAALWEWLRPLHTSFSHGASLSPKRLRQDRRDSGVSAAVRKRLDLVYRRSPTGCAIPQAAQARPEGFRCIGRCVAVAWPMHTSFSQGKSLSPSDPSRCRETRV